MTRGTATTVGFEGWAHSAVSISRVYCAIPPCPPKPSVAIVRTLKALLLCETVWGARGTGSCGGYGEGNARWPRAPENLSTCADSTLARMLTLSYDARQAPLFAQFPGRCARVAPARRPRKLVRGWPCGLQRVTRGGGEPHDHEQYLPGGRPDLLAAPTRGKSPTLEPQHLRPLVLRAWVGTSKHGSPRRNERGSALQHLI